MKTTCRECGRTAYLNNREVQKEARYDEYEILLARAQAAGASAIEYRANESAPFTHGEVWLALDDGRSSFARFIHARHPGLFTFRNRQRGTCHAVDYIEDFTAAVDYAIAFRDVLAEGGVSITLISRPIEHDI